MNRGGQKKTKQLLLRVWPCLDVAVDVKGVKPADRCEEVIAPAALHYAYASTTVKRRKLIRHSNGKNKEFALDQIWFCVCRGTSLSAILFETRRLEP